MLADASTNWKSRQFRACAEIITAKTEARVWIPDDTHSYGDILDDRGLRRKMEDLTAFWDTQNEAVDSQTLQRLAIVTVPIDKNRDPLRATRPIRIQSDTLSYVMQILGVNERASKNFWNSILPTAHCHKQYDDGPDRPTSMTILFRCPRLSNTVIGIIRVHFQTRNCIAFLASTLSRDTDDIIASCQEHVILLRKHPLYLLSFIFDYRFLRWTDWYADIWKSLVEVETATAMTHPRWRIEVVDPERQEFLASSDGLISQLHAVHVEFCHSSTVTSFALKFGTLCSTALAEVEDGRAHLGYKRLSAKDYDALNECFVATLVRCDSMRDRLNELNQRLNSQINVTFNLIAQRDSKINFSIAKLQVHDSRTVKAIGVLTLVFLPATFLATLWSTNLIDLDGDGNWHVFLAVVLVLTFVVLACWLAYGRIARQQDEKHWPSQAGIDSLPLIPNLPTRKGLGFA
ncbi:hypothetical protein HJFPF1_05814 [Paramyrothecium foliicola]|nr:hypothetical protein HJFPF1_05814 [Paramyrothecium foliicola]